MAKAQNWFMEGWEYRSEPDRQGRPRKTLVYTGPWFTLGLEPKALLRLKAAYGFVMVSIPAVFLLTAIWGSGGQEQFYIGAPYMLAIVPGLYMLMGSVWLLAMSEPLTYRDTCGSLRRIRRAGYFSLPLYAIAVLGQLVYICVCQFGSRDFSLSRELLWCCGPVYCAAGTAVQLWLTGRYPARMCKKPN